MRHGVRAGAQPDETFLLDEIICTAIDYAEIVPETTWWTDGDTPLVANDFHRLFTGIVRENGLFAVAHGVGLSLGSAWPGDAPRQAAWLARMRADREVFDYRWYSEHLGASTLGGMSMVRLGQ